METLAAWRDASIVLLSLEAMILSLIPAAILYFLLRGVMALMRTIRFYGPIVRGYFRQAASISEQVSLKVAAPVIIVNEKTEQARASATALAAVIKGRKEV